MLVSIAIAGSLLVYQKYVVPRTPLKWLEFNPECLDTIADTKRPVLISIQDLTFTKQPDLQYYLEHDVDNFPNGEFRTFVHQHKILLYTFSFSIARFGKDNENGLNSAHAIHEMLHEQYPEFDEDVFLVPEFVLAIPNHDRLIFFREQFPDSDDIMAAVLSDGEVLEGETYFSDRYQ